MSRWTFLVGECRTGRILEELPLTGPQWSAPLNDAGSFSASLPIDEPALDGLDLRQLLRPGRNFLALDLDGLLLFAGPLWSAKYKKKARTLDLAAAGLFSLFDHRKIMPTAGVNDPNQTGSTAAQTNLWGAAGQANNAGTTPRGLARQLLAAALTYTGGDLPLTFPDGTPLSTPLPEEYTVTRADSVFHSVYGFMLAWTADKIRQYQKQYLGPELDLVPRYAVNRPGFIEWTLRLGAPYLTQPGAPWLLDANDYSDLEVDVDGTGLAVRAWATGKGTNSSLVIAHADNLAALDDGYPILEVDEAHTDAQDTDIPALAAALLASRVNPLEQWTVTTRADASVSPGTYLAGDLFDLVIEADPFLADGTYPCRLTAIGGRGEDLTLTMQPTRGDALPGVIDTRLDFEGRLDALSRAVAATRQQ